MGMPIPNRLVPASRLLDQGDIYLQQLQHVEAVACYDRARVLCSAVDLQQRSHMPLLRMVMHHRGIAYSLMGHYDAAAGDLFNARSLDGPLTMTMAADMTPAEVQDYWLISRDLAFAIGMGGDIDQATVLFEAVTGWFKHHGQAYEATIATGLMGQTYRHSGHNSGNEEHLHCGHDHLSVAAILLRVGPNRRDELVNLLHLYDATREDRGMTSLSPRDYRTTKAFYRKRIIELLANSQAGAPVLRLRFWLQRLKFPAPIIGLIIATYLRLEPRLNSRQISES